MRCESDRRGRIARRTTSWLDNFDSGIDSTSPTCRPSTSNNAVPVSSSFAGGVAVIACATRWASNTPSGFRQRLTKVVRSSVIPWPSGRRVAIRSASERSVLSEKFHRSGSWDAMTIFRAKSRSMRERVCSQDVRCTRWRATPEPDVLHRDAASAKPLQRKQRRAPQWRTPASPSGDATTRSEASAALLLGGCQTAGCRHERVNGGFRIAKSRSGSVAVTPSFAPREPLPDTLSASLVPTPMSSTDSAN